MCTALIGPPAHADTPTTLIRSWATGVCLDSNYAGAAYVGGCNFGTYQNWQWDVVSTPFRSSILFRDAETNRCLDSNFAGNVYTSPCDAGNRFQQWFVTNPTGAVYQFQNHATGLALDNNGTSLYTSPPNGGGYQDWKNGF
jgi:hypothetical protein